jgi:hypothetical protein
MLRLRDDKPLHEADSMRTVEALLTDGARPDGARPGEGDDLGG